MIVQEFEPDSESSYFNKCKNIDVVILKMWVFIKYKEAVYESVSIMPSIAA